MRRVVTVDERVRETPSTVTLRYHDDAPAGAGQFVMLWIPGDDEIPMSLSYLGARKGLTVKAMGSTSRGVLALERGQRIGVRGPYGNTFATSARHPLVVAGGSGAAVLAPAAEAVRARGGAVDVALGATTAAELLFEGRFRDLGAPVEVATDDGSRGRKGYVTQLVEPRLRAGDIDVVWTCGPEVMMQKVIDAGRAAGVPVVCSVERWMKCALGMCDACALGPYHVCRDGPVFPAELLAPLPEFGRTKRDSSGRRVPH